MGSLQGSTGYVLSGDTAQNSLQECIENCNDCHQVCLETINYCLNSGEHLEDPALFRALYDCATLTQVSADLLIRHSDLHAMICHVCAEACLRCALQCVRFREEQFKDCEEACRRCNDSCQEMQTQH